MHKFTKTPPRRGRPRAYDPDTALEQALQVFWKNGFAGTTLEMLVAATGMNRPSLDAAFGSKQAIYLKSFERFTTRMSEQLSAPLEKEQRIDLALEKFFAIAIDLYVSGGSEPRGCFAIVTAATESSTEPMIRKSLAQVLKQMDEGLEKRLALAQESGQIAPDADVTGLAQLAAATLHSLAVRARAGQRRATLETLARTAVASIVGNS